MAAARPARLRKKTQDRLSADGRMATRTARLNIVSSQSRFARTLRALIIVVLSFACLAVAYAVVSLTPLFSIEHLLIDRTEHVSEDTITKLAHIEAGTTLLNLDEAAVRAQIEKNPWVGTVEFKREFPSTLRISVSERSIAAIVYMNVNSVAWYLGDNDKWIEPVTLGESGVVPGATSAALSEYISRARQLGCLLISDVAPDVTPEAGAVLNDETLRAVLDYQAAFSPDLAERVVSYSAPSLEAISCTLQEGVTISLGEPEDISVKEAIVKQLLDTYAGQITYINVRVPQKPSYRKLDTDNVVQGSIDEAVTNSNSQD